jgi:hypothetical protein
LEVALLLKNVLEGHQAACPLIIVEESAKLPSGEILPESLFLEPGEKAAAKMEGKNRSARR